MKNLRQEKSLRDHEPSLNRFAVIAERGEPPAGSTFGESSRLSSEVDSEWQPGWGRPGELTAIRYGSIPTP
jgi:hypothetical protein